MELYRKASFTDIWVPKQYDTYIPVVHVLSFDNYSYKHPSRPALLEPSGTWFYHA